MYLNTLNYSTASLFCSHLCQWASVRLNWVPLKGAVNWARGQRLHMQAPLHFPPISSPA